MENPQLLRRVDVQHVFNVWIAGILKTGTEQEKVDKLADILDCLLAIPEAEEILHRREYESMRKQARDQKPHGPGVDMMRSVLLDASWELARRAIVHPS